MLLDHDDLAETDARRAIMRTLNRDPFDVWTRDELARTLGLSSSLTGRVLGDLLATGLVRRLPGTDGEFTVRRDRRLGDQSGERIRFLADRARLDQAVQPMRRERIDAVAALPAARRPPTRSCRCRHPARRPRAEPSSNGLASPAARSATPAVKSANP
jgi:AraC-like DNA-binding protein